MLAAYGELSEAQKGELDRHQAVCAACRAELADLEELLHAADARPVLEPEANLVARARLRLDEAIEALPPEGWIARLRRGIFGLRLAPAASLLLVGLAVGAGVGYTLGGRPLPQQSAAVRPAVAEKNPQPIVDKKVAPVQTASVAVPAPMKSMTASGAAPGDVTMLAANCRTRQGCKDDERAQLIATLRGNRDPELREVALEGLEPYVTEDLRVRNAVLRALLNDRDARIRAASIQLLEPVDADTSVRQVLYSVSTSDASPQIRNVSRQVLSRMPEIQ